MSDAERFCREAERCRELAETAGNTIDETALEWMASQWLKLAEAADHVRRMLH
jgi:hypothetical protein